METKKEIVYVCNFNSSYDSCFGQCEKCPNCRKEEEEINEEE